MTSPIQLMEEQEQQQNQTTLTNHHHHSPPLHAMENLSNQHQPSPSPLLVPPPGSDSDSDPDSSNHITLSPSQLTSPPHSDHITLSPLPHHSDSSSSSGHTSISHSHRPSLEDNKDQTPTPPHSDHITLSPPPHHSPDHSDSSDHSTVFHRPSLENKNNKSHSPEKQAPPPQPTVYRNVAEQPVAIRNSVSLEKPVPVVSKTDPDIAAGGGGGAGGDVRRKFSPKLSILKRGKREKVVKRAGLGLRVLGFMFCLVSFAVMAADQNQGWAVDSFHRYIEFRYCMAVNVIGFVYSGAQAIDSSYNLATGKYISQHQQVRRYLDFAFDQIVAYLLISASSSAATRIDDWQSNWGKDKFPDMATGSVAMSFLAFVAIALSSLVSGYALCTSKSM